MSSSPRSRASITITFQGRHEYSGRTGQSIEQFSAFLDEKFPSEIVAHEIDPLFAINDGDFFDKLAESETANFEFDLQLYWSDSVEPIDTDARVLTFANSAAATYEVLDIDVALDRRAARNIVDHRNGADGQRGSGDDDLFETVDELDAIPYVGRSALQKLESFVLLEH